MPNCKEPPHCPYPGEPCYSTLNDFAADVHYCVEHKIKHHFCVECGLKLTADEINDKDPLCQLCLALIKQNMNDANLQAFFKEISNAHR